jgi:hypothetical protein
MLGEGNSKLCAFQDGSLVTKGGGMSCAICCGRSDDPAELCDPVEKSGDSLFCDTTP